MKRLIVVLAMTLCSVGAFCQVKTAEDNANWPQIIVQRAFSEVSSGLRTSSSERYLSRLGDRAAPEIMKCVSARPFTRQNSETALTLVKMSFAYPNSIRRAQDRAPANTVLLLDYLDKHTSEDGTKSAISSLREKLRAQSPVTE